MNSIDHKVGIKYIAHNSVLKPYSDITNSIRPRKNGPLCGATEWRECGSPQVSTAAKATFALVVARW